MTADGRVIRHPEAFSKRGPKIRGRQHEPEHLAFIHTLPCLIHGTYDNVEAAHIRYSDARWGKINPGIGRKPDDRWVVPLSAEIHRLDPRLSQHSMNERAFWESHGIDPLPIARDLWLASGHLEICLRILRREI